MLSINLVVEYLFIAKNQMAENPEQLIVRQFQRHDCSLPASLSIAEDSSDQVILSQSIIRSCGTIPVTIVDISLGGFGIELSIFIPKATQLNIQIFGLTCSLDSGSDQPLLEASVCVQRIKMISREPSYYLGTSIGNSESVKQSKIDELIEHFNQYAPVKKGDSNV